MFTAKLSDANIFKSAFEAISYIVVEIKIKVSKEGLRVNALDKSCITFVELFFSDILFDSYSVDEELELNIDAEELVKILKRLKSTDTFILEAKEDTGKLKLIFEPQDLGACKRSFNIHLIDMDYKPMQPPKLDYPAKYSLPFKLFKTTVQDVALFSEKIVLAYNPNEEEYNITMSGNNDFGGVEVRAIAEEDFNSAEGANVQSKFALEKIQHMLKADKFSEDIIFYLGNDMPLRLVLEYFKPGASDEPVAELGFLLAPRVEED